MLQALKNFSADRAELDEMVALLAFGKQMQAVYAEQTVEAPDWFKENLGLIEKEVKARRRDSLERALKSAKARKEALKSAEDKRKDVESEIERLEKALG